MGDLSQHGAYWASGTKVGKYVLVAPLARGGMAEVWIARQEGPTGFSREVVLKRILAIEERDSAFVQMFLDEARIVAQLNHPNIVHIIELDVSLGHYFMAMEYLHGESLAHLVRQCLQAGEPLSIPLAVMVAAEAAAGLGYAHLRRARDGQPLGIVHRDVSPQNIVVTYEGIVKIVDFGIAKARARATETASGVVKGKMSYMAPEQAIGLPVEARADVFALGVVLFETVTGTRLYEELDDVRIVKRLMDPTSAPSARARNEKVPVSLDAIIARALSRNLEERYPDGHAFHLALMEWLRSEVGGGPSRAELGALMTRLFSKRIEERERLLASTSVAPEVPFEPEIEVGHTPVTMPGITPRGPDQLPSGLRALEGAALNAPRRRWALSLGALGLLMLAVLAWAWGRQTTSESSSSTSATPTAEPSHDAPQAVIVRQGAPPAKVREETPAPPPPLPPPLKSAPQQAQAARPSPQKAVAVGRLSLETEPWTEVFLGKRLLGETPLIEVTLPVGKHRLRLRNQAEKVDREVEVDILAREVTTKRLRFD